MLKRTGEARWPASVTVTAGPGDLRISPRQCEVLRLVSRGLSNAEIGAELGISLNGAKWHVSELLGALGFDSRGEAARWMRSRPEAA